MITPIATARKIPGATRLPSTKAMAAPLEPSLKRAAREIVATSPSQSPVADTT